MNRKVTREQNDIAIRNLPKRLQTRIVEKVGNGSLVTADTEGQSAGAGTATASAAGRCDADKKYTKLLLKGEAQTAMSSNDDATPPIDFFMQKGNTTTVARKSNKSAAPVLETSGHAAGVVVGGGGGGVTGTQRSSSGLGGKNTKMDDIAAIPGILRLGDAEKAQLVANEKTPTASNMGGGTRENDKKFVTRSMEPHHEQFGREEQLLTKSPVRVQQRIAQPPWFKTLVEFPYARQAAKSYETLMMLQQRELILENWFEFCDARTELQTTFGKLLLQQLKLCCEQKVDNFFWKLLYYNIREYLKNQKSDIAYKHLLTLIDEGLQFYTDLYAQFNAKYILMKTAPTHSHTVKKLIKFETIAKVTAQKLLICLGDLSRYKAKELQSNDYTEATKYYLEAQRLMPTNGIPYNQLAIVAIHERKRFDAIYFHMRSLMSSNAIHSARESLLVLFDEMRKKYEETELKTSPLHQCSPKQGSCKTSKSLRKEVWIRPDGVRRLHCASESSTCGDTYEMTISNEEKRCDELATDDLLRRFTSLYLYIIGKLYTGIGMETILDHQRKLLVQLSSLLKRTPLPITRSRLLKTVALNIFVLDHNIHKETRREIRYYAFSFCNQILGIILRKCSQLCELSSANAADGQELCFTDLITLMQYINIYTTWLSQNFNIWEPVRNKDHTIVDTWCEWECFYIHLQDLLVQRENSTEGNVTSSSQQLSLLEEESYLFGFTPLTGSTTVTATSLNYDVISTADTAQFYTRILRICDFQRCYADNNEYLNFTLEELNNAMQKAFYNLDSDDDDNSENIVINGTNLEKANNDKKTGKATDVEDAQISQLSKRKRELEAKTNEKKMYSAKLEEILKFVDTKLCIEVRPRYLLPDTNCFIDCLDDVERLIKEFRRYMLVIPLTVVKELDGLSKGVKLESRESTLQMHRIHHYDDVSTCAKKSLDFIRAAKNNVKCATTKGSFINASLFALAEEENVSNDDKILATALALAKTMSTETNNDGKCLIQTELVLITTDRNLRVKALARNLAVSELSEFLQWAKDCN